MTEVTNLAAQEIYQLQQTQFMSKVMTMLAMEVVDYSYGEQKLNFKQEIIVQKIMEQLLNLI